MLPSLCEIALYRKCLEGSSGAVSLFIWAGYSRNSPCVHSFIIIGTWLLMSRLWVGSPLRLAASEGQPQCYSASYPVIRDFLSQKLGLPWVSHLIDPVQSYTSFPHRGVSLGSHWLLPLWAVEGDVCGGDPNCYFPPLYLTWFLDSPLHVPLTSVVSFLLVAVIPSSQHHSLQQCMFVPW